MKWGMVIDLTKCCRCHACVAACRVEHFLPLRVAWVKLIASETEEGGVVDVSTFPVRCNQCKEAPCVDVCPTGATQQRDGRHRVDRCQQVHRLPLLRHRLSLPEPHLSVQRQGSGLFPGICQNQFRERWAKNSIPIRSAPP